MARPKISYGSGRAEWITYELAGKKVDIDFTWLEGNRIYTETIHRWSTNELISEDEKKKILTDVLQFTKGWFRKSIVVINTDDLSRPLWEQVCGEVPNLIKEIEYTSDEQNRQYNRQMYLEMLNSKGGLVIDDVPIRTERELDAMLAKLEPRA